MLDVNYVAELIHITLQGSPFPDVPRAIPLLLGTAAQESALTYTEQLGGGPALGYWQIESATEASLWNDFLAYDAPRRHWIVTRCGVDGPNSGALQYDKGYGILLARLIYFWMDPHPLPDPDDIEEAAKRWKAYYNTPAGAGTEEEYIASYQTYIAPYYPQPRRHGQA